jgi:hypothetical protein
MKSRNIAYDFYRINSLFKKVYNQNVMTPTKGIITNIRYFDVGLWFESHCEDEVIRVV